MYRGFHLLLAFVLSVSASAQGGAGADQRALSDRVIVLANKSHAESLRLANYYADKRDIPAANVIALPMSMAESISWTEFITSIYQPLQDELFRRKWIDGMLGDIRDKMGRRKISPSGHRIAYLVVCRGVPLKIEHAGELYAPAPPVTDRTEFQTNAGAVDSELSLIAAGNYPTAGLIPNPLYGKLRPTVFEQHRIVKVSRLDGPSQSSATALIDNALQGERTGLIGRAYVDIGGPHAAGDVWFEAVAKQIEDVHFDHTVDRTQATFPSTARFDAPALYFGWYASDMNGPFLQPEFKFPPGAIALHLHSFSARSIASPHYGWTAPFVSRGVTATVGNVFEPYLDFTHHPHQLLRCLLGGSTWGDAVFFSLRGLSWHAIAIGDPLYRPFAKRFTQQWADRAQLDDQQYGYVALRELRRLERDGQLDQAVKLAAEAMLERPSRILALKSAQLAETAGVRDVAIQAARAAAETTRPRPSEIPLILEAAEILARLGEGDSALQVVTRLLQNPAFPADFVREAVAAGEKYASSFPQSSALDAWQAEHRRVAAPR